MNNCNHIIGLSVSTLRDISSQEIVAAFQTKVTASEAGLDKDGRVKIWWAGERYKFCPLCGEALGCLEMTGFDFSNSNLKDGE